MESMRDLRLRMRSVRQSMKLTDAMCMIATSKLRKARKQLEETRPYFESLLDAMKDISAHLDTGDSPWFDTRKLKSPRQIATIVISSDSGMAGGFNSDIVRFAKTHCPEGSIIMPIGAIAKRRFMEENYVILEDFSSGRKVPTVYEARDIANFIVDRFLSGTIDEFRIVYTRMLSAVKLVPAIEQLLPLSKQDFKEEKIGSRFYCEPDTTTALEALVPIYIKGLVYNGLVESFASEQSARMTAMDGASQNANKMMGSLSLSYNRARQAAITAEVSEIVAGAAAVNE